jgi:organic radical activating enzyme
MNLNRDTHIQALSVISSCGCNLNCSYCRISQSKNAGSSELQKNTIKALQDGTFLANINKALNRIGQSTSQIDNLAFWGQEPTLTLHHITDHIEEWFEYFPNWQECMFSTNTIAFTDRIYDFIIALDKHCKMPVFQLNVQFSYDGDYSTNNLRKGSSSQIHDNIKSLIEKLNNTNLNKVRVRVTHHGVLSLELLKKLQTPEAILEYSNHMVNWGKEFHELNTNRHVYTAPEVDIAPENPVEANTMDGLRLNNFCELSNRLNPGKRDSFKYHLGAVDPVHGLYKGGWFPLHLIVEAMHNCGFDTLDEAVQGIIDNPMLKREFFDSLNPALYCGNGVGELKVMYDGTLINCQNHIFETQEELIHDDNERIEAVKKSLASHGYFINPITATDDEVDKYFSLFHNAKFTSFEFTLHSIVILMKMLSITSQIDTSYRDDFKLLKHAIVLTVMGCCSYNNQVMTGSLFMRHTGYLRLMCNGYLDHLTYDFNEHEGGLII